MVQKAIRMQHLKQPTPFKYHHSPSEIPTKNERAESSCRGFWHLALLRHSEKQNHQKDITHLRIPSGVLLLKAIGRSKINHWNESKLASFLGFIARENTAMDSKKTNKISEIVRLQQILKKWKKLANAPKPSCSGGSGGSKSMKFLKRTLSLTDSSSSSAGSYLSHGGCSDVGAVPKGFLAVSVGEEMKRFVIPTEYLSHRAFSILLREAEEEFGFQQEGVLRIPCEVPVFERILKVVEQKKEVFFMQELVLGGEDMVGPCASRAEICPSPHPPKPLCR